MGILEQILAAIQQNTAAINAAANTGGIGNSPMIPAGTPVLNAGPVNPPPVGVTSGQVMALIQPHITNEAIKVALGNAMRTLGVNALPEAQPHHFGPLYQAFQAVIAQHLAAAPAATTSII